MGQTVFWDPNTDSTTLYQVWSSSDNISFTLLATVAADTGGPNFNTNTNQFFYIDTVNTSTTWYKVRAGDDLGDFSAYTISKQGEPFVLPTCRIYGRVVGFDGVPIAGTAIAVHIESSAQDMSGQFIGPVGILSNNVEAYTDDDGDWEIDLAQAGIADIEIASINFEKTFTVPSTAVANLIDLI